MKSTIVPVNNVTRLAIAGNELMNRPFGAPGLGLVYGKPGLGKTTAVTWYVNQVNGVYVRAMRCCTPLSLLQDICEELGLDAPRTSRAAIRAITRAMAEDNRPLFIDEADYLMDRGDLVETVRDIHDVSTVPVILIGMDKIAKKLKNFPQFESRVMAWVGFGLCKFDDARKIADDMCEGFRVADDLLQALLSAANGEIRRIVVGLHQLEKVAKSKGLEVLAQRDFEGAFFLGHKAA
ncbi:AAA family ATPase [Aeromonas piscicola]|uniref:AAA family ATPase n=1 Tax=Aeromonas piscicola TaxID=600645 RepID=UPI0005B4B478|nr:ATP-binding protein [Aeromonas piscicola]